MILFYASVPTTLFYAMTYKMAKRRGEKAAIVIHRGLYKTNSYLQFLEKIVDEGIFSHVFYQEKFICVNMEKNMPNDDKLIEEKFVNIFDGMFESAGMDIHDFKEVYFLTDDWNGDFGLYLYYKKVPYYWLNAFKSNVGIKTRKFPSNALNRVIQETRAFSAVAEYAKPILQKKADPDVVTTVKKYKGDIYEIWDPEECLEELRDEEINKIVECNDIRQDDLQGISMVLFNSCGYAGKQGAYRNIEARKRKYGYGAEWANEFYYNTVMYSMAIDMFMKVPKKLFLKIHPNERLNEKEFCNYFAIAAKSFPSIPFELVILYLRRNKIVMDEILAVDSNADKMIGKDVANNVITLGSDYFKTWSFFFSLYISYQIYLKLKKPGYKLYVSKLLKSQFELLCRLCGEKVEINTYRDKIEISKLSNSFVIVDEIEKQLDKKELLEYSNVVDVVLINVDLQNHSAQDEIDIYDNSTCIKINKIPIDMSLVTAPLYYDEYLWIRTKDKNKAQIINRFQYETQMKCSNLQVVARRLTLQEEAEYIREKKNFYRLESIRYSLTKGNIIIKTLTEHVIGQMDDNKIRAWLKDINDVECYLEVLRSLEKKYTILLAVRDTPGSKMPTSVVEQIKGLGFRGFVKDLWMTYVGMVDGNHLICDKRGDAKESPVDFEYEYHSVNGRHMFCLSSQAWRKGDKASIIIDGKDYAVNMRGLNFVVLNLISGHVLDSVGIDMHTFDFKIAHA